MRMVDPRTGIEVLDEDECLRLLGADEIGRLAVVDATTPMIFPVNYVLDGRSIVFRTAEGTKLDHGQRAGACFEIDAFDRATRTGWSVVATGRLEEITTYDSDALAEAKALPIEPWAAGDKPHWMRLQPTRITGRRVGPPR
jgi:nitroimidazol reductase NimA-like FMN-containing flavoprotein (pyridoxamine 5'-phosphate oxidase superfamily)